MEVQHYMKAYFKEIISIKVRTWPWLEGNGENDNPRSKESSHKLIRLKITSMWKH